MGVKKQRDEAFHQHRWQYLHHHVAHAAVCEDYAVGSLADELCLLKALGPVAALSNSLHVVQQHVLEEDNRVVAADGLRTTQEALLPSEIPTASLDGININTMGIR